MSLLRRASSRWLVRHPGQLVLTVAGVAMGVAVVVAIDLAIQSAREAFRLSTEAVAGRATHRVEGGPGGLAPAVFTHLRVDLALRRSAPVVEGYASTPRLPGVALRLLGVDPFSERPFRPWVATGEGGPAMSVLLTQPDAVVLSRGMAERASLEVGDTFPLVVQGRSHRAVLAGLLTPTDRLGRQGLSDVVLADVATAQNLVGLGDRLSAIDLILDSVPASRVEAELPPGVVLRPVGTRTDALEGMLKAFDLNLTALSLLALVFGMFLIYNAMTFSVVQRRGLLGALRAIGVTRGEILAMVGSEAVLTGAMGVILGLLGGVILGRGLVRLVTRTVNDLYFVVSVEGLSVPPGVLLKGAAMGLGATLLAALPAVWEAVGSPPRATLTRSVVEERVRRLVPMAAALGSGTGAVGGLLLILPSRSVVLSFAGLFGILLGIALLTPLATVLLVRVVTPLLGRTVGILGTMAARGVAAALSRTAPAMAALVVAVAVTVGLGVMISSFRSTVARWLDHTLQADVYVSPPSPVASRADGSLDPGVVERLTSAPFLAGVSTYRGVEMETEYGVTRVVALDLDPRGERAFRFLEGRPGEAFTAFRSGGGLLVSEPFAYRQRLQVGDSVRLPTRAGERAFPVAGVFSDYGSDQGVVMMARATWSRHFDDPGVTSLGLFLAAGVDSEAAVDSLRALVGPDQAVVIRSNQALRQGSLQVFDRTFAITAVLRALAFAVAFIGVLSALMALQLERGRELGVLRANGLTPGQVWALVTTQTGVLGLVAGVLAVPAGLVLAAVMIFVVNRRSFGWTLTMTVGPDVLLQAVGLAVAGALLAGLYPAWRMARTSPALALRSE